jgi:hypothetical protein
MGLRDRDGTGKARPCETNRAPLNSRQPTLVITQLEANLQFYTSTFLSKYDLCGRNEITLFRRQSDIQIPEL